MKKLFSAIKKVTPDQAVATELAMAELELLKDLSHLEFYESCVGYHRARVTRLRAHKSAPDPGSTMVVAKYVREAT